MKIFSIGVSGLSSAQTALLATSNNISNVYTPGYHREIPVLEQQRVGGVGVGAIQRQFNQFVAAQLNSATSNLSGLDAYHAQVAQIDNLLGSSNTGLAPLLQSFFSSLQDVVASPADPAARMGVIGTANALTAQFRAVDGYLHSMQHSINGQIGNEITGINDTLAQIARLNNEITLAVANRGEAPNALLNQRDAMVNKLAESMDVRVSYLDGVNYSIAMADGKPLVVGGRHFEIEAVMAADDPTRVTVGYDGPAGTPMELGETVFAGGRLGGLMAFRRETLDSVQNGIGLLAASLAHAFNGQHGGGTDLYGNAGGDLFALGAPRLFANDNNSGGAQFSAVFDGTAALSGADYDIRVSDAATGAFVVTRRDTGASFDVALDGANQLAFDGLVLTLDDPAQLVDGDSYLLQPTRNVTQDFANLIRDPGLIAAGQSASSGDNRNALALLDLQNSKVVGGRASLNQAYAGLVSDVGIRTNIAELNLQAQRGFTEQIRVVQQSESGVNLDEEAANLIRYQQYYQANAKIIEVASTLFDTILGVSR